jgi:hypothetical protein
MSSQGIVQRRLRQDRSEFQANRLDSRKTPWGLPDVVPKLICVKAELRGSPQDLAGCLDSKREVTDFGSLQTLFDEFNVAGNLARSF